MFGLWCLKSRLSLEITSFDLLCVCLGRRNDVPLPVMALVLDGIAAKDVWPLRTLANRWAHAVRAVTAFEVSTQAKDHNLIAKLSAIYRRQRNYPVASFVLTLKGIMSFSQAATLLLMVTKMVSVFFMAGAQQRVESIPSKLLAQL